MKFPWLVFLGLLFAYFIVLNTKCWPAGEQKVEGRKQKAESGERQTEIAVLRYQPNPYASPELKLIALNHMQKPMPAIQNPKSKIQNRLSAPPQSAGPHNTDQVLLKVYDAVNGALKANYALPGGTTNPTPHNADQVFLAVYDAVNGAIRINLVGGATAFDVNGTALASSSTVNFQNSAATNGLTLTFSNPAAGNVQLGFSGTLNDAGLTSGYSGVGACAANTWASTLTRNAAPTCTQPAVNNISGVPTLAGQSGFLYDKNGTLELAYPVWGVNWTHAYGMGACNSSSATFCTQTITAPAPRTLLIFACQGQANATLSVSDNSSGPADVWTTIVPLTLYNSNTNVMQVWATTVTSGTVPTTITCTSSLATWLSLLTEGYAGNPAPFVQDGSASVATGSSTTPTATYTTGAIPGDLVWSFVALSSNLAATVAGPLTSRTNFEWIHTADVGVSAGVPASTAYTATYTIGTSEPWATAIVGFQSLAVVP